jgi:hypothetical protein
VVFLLLGPEGTPPQPLGGVYKVLETPIGYDGSVQDR